MSDPHITTGAPAGHSHVTPGSAAGAAPHGEASPAAPFTAAQLHAFHEDDKHAGGAIIVLMTAIFGIGLVLYTVIATIVAQG